MDKKICDMTPIKIEEGYKTVIYLVRHGQSLGNKYGEFLGQMDKDLSELGYEQAERTAEFLNYVPFDVIYSSDLMRAHNTAVPHARRHGLEINDCKELREMDAGIWEGMPISKLIANHSEAFLGEWRGNFGLATLPGGENVQDAAKRFFNAVKRIAEDNEGKTILITAHAAVIRGFWGVISNIEPKDLATTTVYSENAAVSMVYYDGESLIPGEYSHSAHLADLLEG